MVSALVTLVTLPITIGCTAISVSCTAINGVLTTINGTIIVINLTLTAAQGMWALTKITYYGTKKIVEISLVPLTAVSSLFAKRNVLIQQAQVRVQADDSDQLFDEWLAEAEMLPGNEVEDIRDDALAVIQAYDPALVEVVKQFLHKKTVQADT